MPNWFRVTVAIVSVVTISIGYAKPALGSISVALLMLLIVAVGVSEVVIVRSDRRASGADEPTTLDMNRS